MPIHPYYKKRYALEARRLLLPIVELDDDALDNIDITIDSRSKRMGVRTIQQRIKFGWRYLVDFMDPNGAFKLLKTKMAVRRYGEIVKIEKIDITELIAEYRNKEVTDEELIEAGVEGWQTKLVRFVEDAPEGECYRWNQRISEQQLAWLSEFLAPLVSVIVIEQLNLDGVKLTKNSVQAKALAEKGAYG